MLLDKSLTNKLNVIEEIINDSNVSDNEDDDIEINQNEDFYSSTSPRREGVPSNKNVNTEHTPTKIYKRPEKAKSPDVDNPNIHVYDFLSLSQESDTAAAPDPTADIVQKLVKEGKVAVATRRKGKVVIRRKLKSSRNRKKKNGKIKQNNKKKIDEDKIVENIELSDDEINFCDDIPQPKEPSSPEQLSNETQYVEEEVNHIETEQKQNQHHNEGRFSNLAKSVLLQQTEKIRVSNTISFLSKFYYVFVF